MTFVRALLQRNRALAILLVIATLCMKALVPSGFMLGPDVKVLTVQVCNDTLGDNLTRHIVVPMTKDSDGALPDQGKGDGACAFSALSAASLASPGPELLLAALGFILALGFAPVRARPDVRPLYLRPPLRGPPAFA